MFRKITCIILHDGKAVFVLVVHETFFHDHFHDFQVTENIPKILCQERDGLRHFKCSDVQMSYGCDCQFYVVSEICMILFAGIVGLTNPNWNCSC